MIKVLIVDDEPLARRGVRVCLRGAADLAIVGEACSGLEALEKIEQLAPDLVFLDVQMPGMDGLEMLSRIPAEAMPQIIFLTAYDDYALTAFAVHAVDYVMKPIDDPRFKAALDAARQRLRDIRAGKQLAGIQALLADEEHRQQRRYREHFVAKNGNRTLLVGQAEVDWIEAAGDYVILHAGKRTHMIHETMAMLERQLDPARFVRVHRSTIIAVDRIGGFNLLASRDATVTLKDGTGLRVSRRYRHKLPAGNGARYNS